MRLLAIDQFGDIAGAQRCLVDAVAGFASRGWETYGAVPEGPLARELRGCCRAVSAIACGPFTGGSKTAQDAVRFTSQIGPQTATIRRIIAERSIDALYVNGPRVMPAAAIAGGRRIPVVFHAHSRLSQRAASRVLRSALDWSGAYVVGSSHFVGDPLRAAAIVPNGVPPNPHRRRAGGRPFTVATVGRIAPEKGQLDFIRARVPGCRFLIVGAPLFSAEPYARQVAEAAQRAGVDMMGWHDDVPRLLAEDVDLLVVPSTEIDATPRIVLEAFAARVPVVAFAVGGIPEMIRDGVSGILVRPRTAEALAAAIAGCFHAPERLRTIAANAHATNWDVRDYQTAVCAAVGDAVARRHQRKPLAIAGAIAEK